MHNATLRVAHASLALGSLAALVGCSSEAMPQDPATEETNAAEESEQPVANAPADEVSEDATDAEGMPAGYTDGTYQAEGGYQSPNGAETIAVSVSIEAGVISAVTVTPQPTNSTTERYQGYFAEGIAAEVLGKSLDEVSVTRVAGSSLTGGGFAQALELIKQDAKAP